jgi:hypothetical protein
MSYTLMPAPKFVGLDGDGNPLSGGLLYSYAAGTTTPKATYSDSIGTPNTNPVVLDSAGRATVYLYVGAYKFILTDADGVAVWTQDNVIPTLVGYPTLGDVKYMGGDPTSPVTAVAYPSGTGFDKGHAGTVWFYEDSANLVGTYVLEGMLMGYGGGTVTVALVNLTDGTPDTALVEITSASTTGARVRSTAITFPVAGTSKNYGVKAKVDAGSGFAWGLTLLRTA